MSPESLIDRIAKPTPQVGDVWEYIDGERVTLIRHEEGTDWWITRIGAQQGYCRKLVPGWRLVERDGKPWPPAQEQEPTRKSDLVPAEAGTTCDVCHAPAETCDLADDEAPHRCAEHVGQD